MSYWKAISQNVLVDTASSVSDATIVPYVNPADIWNYNGIGTPTLGVNAIQVVVTADKNLTIYVDQGNASGSFQLTDEYNYLTTHPFGITIQAVGAFVRVRAKNSTSANATATIDTVLCPIVEALPRSLDESGHLKVGVKSIEDSYGFEAENTPAGELRTVTPVRLVGVSFEGSTIDPNFWTVVTGSGGTVSQASGRLDLQTNTTASGSAFFYSVRRARYVTGAALSYRCHGRLGDTGTTNNIRQWGAGLVANYTLTVNSATVVAGDVYTDISGIQYTVLISTTGTTITVNATGVPTAGARTYTRINGTGAASLTGSAFAIASTVTDGYYFQMSGSIFSVVTAISGASTPIDSGNFNGSLGATYVPNTSVQTWEIYWTNKTTYFAINDKILHSVSNSLTPLSNTQTLGIFFSNANYSGITTNVGLYARNVAIRRLGPLSTQPTSKYQTGTATSILKYGPGNLHSVVIGGNGTVILYDGLSLNAPIITSLNVNTGHFDYKGLPFYNGLTCITSGTVLATIIYE